MTRFYFLPFCKVYHTKHHTAITIRFHERHSPGSAISVVEKSLADETK